MSILQKIWESLKAWDKKEGEKQRIMKSSTKQGIVLAIVCLLSVYVGFFLYGDCKLNEAIFIKNIHPLHSGIGEGIFGICQFISVF